MIIFCRRSFSYMYKPGLSQTTNKCLLIGVNSTNKAFLRKVEHFSDGTRQAARCVPHVVHVCDTPRCWIWYSVESPANKVAGRKWRELELISPSTDFAQCLMISNGIVLISRDWLAQLSKMNRTIFPHVTTVTCWSHPTTGWLPGHQRSGLGGATEAPQPLWRPLRRRDWKAAHPRNYNN